MVGEAGAQDLLCLGELRDFAQFLGERKEEATLRIRLEPESQLFDLRIAGPLSHGALACEFFLNLWGGATSLLKKRTAPRRGGSSNSMFLLLRVLLGLTTQGQRACAGIRIDRQRALIRSGCRSGVVHPDREWVALTEIGRGRRP